MDSKKILQSSEYDFIRNHEHFGERNMLLGLGGGYANEQPARGVI